MSGPRRRLIVEADGGSRGNPGVAGYGAVLRDATTSVTLRELAAPLGTASNNVAEYSGLVAGLTAVAEMAQPTDVTVRMDSKLVVEQMSGRWKIKHADMQELAALAREQQRCIEANGGSVRYEWIPREKNKAADALSNEGMDGFTVDRSPGDADDVEDPESVVVVDHTHGAHSVREAMRDAGRGDVASDTGPRIPEDLVIASGSCATTIRVVLVRHGESTASATGRIDGHGGCDPSLTERGLTQAVQCVTGLRGFLGDAPLGAAVVVTSDLRRTHAVGDALREHGCGQADVDPRWAEQGMGEWDGRVLTDVAEEFPEHLRNVRVHDDAAPPGGESFIEVQHRTWAAFCDVVQRARSEEGAVAVVVTHRTPILSVLAAVLGMNRLQSWRLNIELGSLTSIVVYPDGEVTVEFVNDTRHLS